MVAELVKPRTSDAVMEPPASEDPGLATSYVLETPDLARAREVHTAPQRQVRFVRLNLLLAGLMVLDGILEALIYADTSLLFGALFAAVPFAWIALHLNRVDAARTRTPLTVSGVVCIALAALCIDSGVTAFTSTPCDVACVVMSIAFLGILSAAGFSQLRSANLHS
jgi:hypothetical protein